MDELTNAARALRERREFDPPPIDTIERRLRRRRQHQRRLFAAVVAVVVVVGGAIAAVAATNGNGPKERIVTTQPPITAPPSTTPTTHAPTTTTSSREGKPEESTTYPAGPFDITEYAWGGEYPSGPLTLTPGVVWISDFHRLLRFDPRRGTVTKAVEIGSGVAELTSSTHTVYALTREHGVVAIDAVTMHVRWRAKLAGSAIAKLALGRNALWATAKSGGAWTLVSLDPGTGRVAATISLPQEPVGLVAAPTNVFAGAADSMLRIAPGSPNPVTQFPLGGSFTPLAVTADGTGVWGTLQAGQYTSDVRLVLISAKDGRVLASLPYAVNGLAPVSDREAWFTADLGVIGVLDMSATKVTQTGGAQTVSSNGPTDIHALDGVGWAVNGYAHRLVRITRH